MRKLYRIFIDNETDNTLYYKSTAINIVIPNIKRILENKNIKYTAIELKEL